MTFAKHREGHVLTCTDPRAAGAALRKVRSEVRNRELLRVLGLTVTTHGEAQ